MYIEILHGGRRGARNTLFVRRSFSSAGLIDAKNRHKMNLLPGPLLWQSSVAVMWREGLSGNRQPSGGAGAPFTGAQARGSGATGSVAQRGAGAGEWGEWNGGFAEGLPPRGRAGAAGVHRDPRAQGVGGPDNVRWPWRWGG